MPTVPGIWEIFFKIKLFLGPQEAHIINIRRSVHHIIQGKKYDHISALWERKCNEDYSERGWNGEHWNLIFLPNWLLFILFSRQTFFALLPILYIHSRKVKDLKSFSKL